MLEARRWLTRLAAAARPAGGPAEARARAQCAAHLAVHGYAVREVPFEYSAAPGRLATPLAGVVWMITIAVAGHLGFHGHPVGAAGTLVIVAVAMVGGIWWLGR